MEMDRNLQQVIPPPASDRATQIGTSSEISGLTGHNSRDLVEHEEIASPGLQTAESMSTEWTDEKHSLYLNSMEALFVKQLYNHEYRSVNLLGWSSRSENLLDPDSSQQLNEDTRISSGQFKVLRSGCWKKLNFERAQPRLDIANESRLLPGNPWVQHFRPVGKRREVTSPNLQENGALCSEAIQLGWQKTASCGVATSSKKFPACQTQPCHQDSVGSETEVSDQNFVDEDHEGKESTSMCRKKRMKTLGTRASTIDQVVPNGKSPITTDPNENHASPEREERVHTVGQSQNMDGFVCLESGRPFFVDQELDEGDSNTESSSL